jgi:ElaB/YqjD/DUF883 family membrane-anchored ribosome-binding protein
MNRNEKPEINQKNIRESLHNAQEKITEKAQESFSDASEKLNEAKDYVIDYVQKNPLKAVGYSVFAGMLVAQLLRTRN